MIASLKRGDAVGGRGAAGEPPALLTTTSSRPCSAAIARDERVDLLGVAHVAGHERRARPRPPASLRPQTTTVAPAVGQRGRRWPRRCPWCRR